MYEKKDPDFETIKEKKVILLTKLYQWWNENRRNFPWRFSRDPYRVLLAEIFLHRTAARQVSRVFQRFLERFPDMETLLQTPPEILKEYLRPLGLRWRQELFLKMLETVRREYGGRIPTDPEELKKLPGIGNYIAGAVAVFLDGKPEIILDSGMVRFLGRFFCQKITDGSRRSKKFALLMKSLMDEEDPRKFYYALIDFTSLICLPRKPRCEKCPISELCCYFLKNDGGG